MNQDDLMHASNEAERALLGALILDRDAMPAVAGMVITEAFSLGRHRLIFDAVSRLWERRAPADMVTVLSEIRSGGVDSRKLPDDYIVGLVADVPSAVHAPWYAEQVMGFARRRALIAAGSKLVSACYGDAEASETGELVAMIRDAAEPFEAASHTATVDVAEYALERAERSLAIWDGTFTERVTPTRISQLDRLLTGGLRPGQLVAVGARPGMGKSSLMVHLARSMPVHLVSLEMSRGEVMDRIIAAVGDLPFFVGSDRIGDVRQRERWIDAAKTAAALPVTINDRPGQTMAQIEGEAARLVAERGIGAIVIDHLDHIGDQGRDNEGETAWTGKITRRAKQMARALDVPVILLAQLNRNVETRPGMVPHLADFRNSGAVEQDADVALLLYRRRYYSERGRITADPDQDYITATNLHRLEVHVAKNRNGAVGTAEVGWSPESMRFCDVREVA